MAQESQLKNQTFVELDILTNDMQIINTPKNKNNAEDYPQLKNQTFVELDTPDGHNYHENWHKYDNCDDYDNDGKKRKSFLTRYALEPLKFINKYSGILVLGVSLYVAFGVRKLNITSNRPTGGEGTEIMF